MSEVSVVVTTFNQAPYIAAALDSVLAQTHPVREIVVDDGSTDGTRAALAPYRDRIRYIRQGNAGVAAARNAGVAAAGGELVALLDGDDLWRPEKLARQVEAAAAHPGAALVAANGVIFSADGEQARHLFGEAILARLSGRDMVECDYYDDLLPGNVIFTTSQVLIPRWALNRVGPSDTRYATCSDWDLYLRLARDHPMVFLGARLVRWRAVESSASGPPEQRRLRWALDEIPILKEERRRGRPGREQRVQRLIHDRSRRMARAAYARGDHGHQPWARRYLLAMWRRQHARVFLLYLAAGYVPPRWRRLVTGPLRALRRKRRR